MKSSPPITSQKIQRLRFYLVLRQKLQNYIRNTLTGMKNYDQLFLLITAAIIGIIGGVIAAGFQQLIGGFRTLFWGSGHFLEVIRETPVWLRILIPAIGGAAVAWFVYKFAPEAKGHGVPEVMDAVASKNGFIRMRVVLVKALASAVTIASGGSVGREGPIVQIGSAFGSSIGQMLQVSRRRMKTFVGCGAAAGIAATFNAPIAGAIFASEIILGDFSAASIGPLMISSVMATVVAHSIIGDFTAFTPPSYALNSPVELVFYVLLGIAAGLVGWSFIKILYRTEDLFNNIRHHVAIKAVIGGAILGGVALFFPQIMGVGYETIDLVLAGQLTATLALILLVTKILATSLTLGYGGSGGIFAPSLFMGSMLGGAMGGLFNHFFPALGISPGAYALVGMAAVVSATTWAPITGILIIFEMTMEYTVILPVMISSIIAMILTQRLSDGSIYTIKLKRRGIDLFRGRNINVLNRLEVAKIKRTACDTIAATASAQDALTKIAQCEGAHLYVTDEHGALIGTLSLGSVRRYLSRHEELPAQAAAIDLANTRYKMITDHTQVDEALRLMTELDVSNLAVIDDDSVLSGTIFKEDILREYQELLLQEESAHSVGSALKFVQKYDHPKTEVIRGFFLANIDVPSPFVNSTVPALNIRKKYDVDVLLIRRKTDEGYSNLTPGPRVRLQSGDQILLFGEEKKVDRVCQLN
ncbi:MAG: chloride channel protein [Candidatus Neomarinimicrobiota bacterium]